MSQPQRLAALALQRGGPPLVLIGNLGPEAVEVELTGLQRASAQHQLAPYAMARIEAQAG